MRTCARIEQGRITISVQLPWLLFDQPKAGEQWRINLLRCIGKNPNRGYLAWQPTMAPEPNFHVPQVFGWLTFV